MYVPRPVAGRVLTGAQFKMHDQEEDEAMAQAVLELKPIIEQNIPLKFRPQA